MAQVFYGFAGDNVEVTKSIKKTYVVPFLDYEICNVLKFLSAEEKFKVIQYIMKINKKPVLFDRVLRNLKGKEKEQLLARCKEQEKKLPKDFCFEIY